MDRELSPEINAAGTTRNDLPDLNLLRSRRAGRDAIRAALLEGRGPVVLTGEPGVGKTTLLRCLEAESSLKTRWIKIDITPATDSRQFYEFLRHGFGLAPGALDRTELADFLTERSLDGDRWGLAIDEAQNLSDELLEETRVLSNCLGDPGGFVSILLIGQTSLALRLTRRSASGLAARIAEHVHLRPLDADEVSRLLRSLDPGHEWPVPLVDRIHLLSGGRPARVAALASRMVARAGLPTTAVAPRNTVPSLSPTRNRPPTEPTRSHFKISEPLVGPSKPPIRVEEGLIEVGWQAESDTEEDAEARGQSKRDNPFERLSGESIEGEQRINDHYAEIQAWQEWATNHKRHLEIPSMIPTEEPDESPAGATAQEASPLSTTPNLWADDEQGMSPFGRLFSRLKTETETEAK